MAFFLRSTLSSISATSLCDPCVLLADRSSHSQQHVSCSEASLSSGCSPRHFPDGGICKYISNEAYRSSGGFVRRFSEIRPIRITTHFSDKSANGFFSRCNIVNLSPHADCFGKDTGGVDNIRLEEYREVRQREVDIGDSTTLSSQVEVKEVEEVIPIGNFEVSSEVGGGEGGGSGNPGWGNGGGGDGGGRGGDEDHSSNEEQRKGMSTSQKLTLAYAALVGLGGLMGYLKSGSTKSLIAGLGSAAVLFYVYTQLPNHPQFASSIGLGVSALLLVAMGSRFRNSRKLFPAGIVALFSFIMTGGYIHGIIRSSHSPT